MPQQPFNREVENANEATSDFMREIVARVFQRSENFVKGRYWLLETLFLAVLFTVLFSGGVDDRLSVASGNYWFPAYFQKIAHPLLDVAKLNPPQNHEAKLNFRLTVPVILHVLHVPPDQRWILPVLAACGTCALILLSGLFAFKSTVDRVCGLYTALAVSATYIGSFGFTMYYDTIALSLVVLAMLPGVAWPWKGLLVFAAAFTDERALLASLFLLIQSLCAAPPGTQFRQGILRPDFVAVIAGMLAYCAGRLALEKFAGLTSPHEGIGLVYVFDNFPFWHAGVWLALKGGWLILGVAAIFLWQRREFLVLAGFALATLLCVGCGFLVQDVLRSTSYVFPALLVALMIIGAQEQVPRMRLYCLLAFVISALAGNYNVWRGHITWFQPVAARMLNYCLHVISGTPISGS